MTLQYADIDDAVLSTQQNFVKKGAFTDLQTDLQDHVLVRELWKGRQKVFEGGDPWEFEAQIDHNWSAKVVGMYEKDGSALSDTLIKGEVHPRHINAHYIYDKHEKAFQRGNKAIVNYIKSKYVGMIVSVWELLEEILWSQPPDDNKTPFGVAYWVTKSATEGFNGPNPTNFPSGKAGISQGTYDRWANWTDDYVAVSGEDLIRKMRKGARQIKFRSPVSHTTPKVGGMKNGVYVGETVIGQIEEVLEDQNMNLGNDVASKDGKAVFKSTPFTYAPYLDRDTSNPVYLLDWMWMALGVMAGWENRTTGPYMVSDMHNVSRVDIDATMNMICTDLRRQAVFYVA